ncbi:MAG: efflux RND transporter periplasmic adaptor subunit [Bacteroidota bacterium]
MYIITKNHLTAAIVSAAIVLTLASCSHKKEESKAPGKPNMLTAEGYVVEPQAFQTSYTASGSLLPNEEIKILPEVAGRVTNISFTEGATVGKGQSLVTIYNEDIRAQIQKLRAQRELQVRIRNRQGELLHIGGISQQDYETTGTQIKSIDADIAYAQAQLRRTSVLAPFSGRIGIRYISVGAVVTPTTVIATLQQTSPLKMDFSVPDQYRQEIAKGKKVTFTVTGTLDTFTATISAVESSADAVTRTLKVRALVPNANQKLVSGSFTRVLIPIEHNNTAILIPPQSVIPTNRDKKVAVVRNGKAEMVTVILGTRTNEMVEILQGLQTGDTILTTGIMQVKPGMTVKIKSITQRTQQ